jgi:Flp pilus assembly protein TadD
LRQVPKDFRLWHVHGLILCHLDRREEAITSLERSLGLAPASPIVAHGLARTLFEAGLPSAEAYGRALELAPGDPVIIAGMTFALFAEGQGDAATRGLEQILRRSPLWAEGHKQLCQLRWMTGEREGFTRSINEALKLHPTDYQLRLQQIVALLHAEHWETALAVIASGRGAMGDLPLFAANEAVCYAELGETVRADRLFEPFHGVDDAPLQIRRVRHLLRSGRPDEAAKAIDPWLEREEAVNFWPYASAAWRLTGDPRWEWLEGDDRFVGVYDITDRLPPLDKLADTLRALHKARGQPLEQSVRGGTQTDGNIFCHIDPVLVALRESIRSVVAEHAASLPARDPCHPLLRSPRSPITFSGSWSVRLQPGGNHANHIHPMGWVSSALYIDLPPDLGKNQAGWLTIGEPQAQLQLDLPPLRVVEPKPGRLVLFPSTMWHGTRPFQVGERLTVAFDVTTPR